VVFFGTYVKVSHHFFYGVRLHLWTSATNIYIVHPPDDMSLESQSRMILTGENWRTWRKTCPSATLSTTNPTWIDTGMNPGLRTERTVTNHLSHGTAPSHHKTQRVKRILLFLCPLWTSLGLHLPATFVLFSSFVVLAREHWVPHLREYAC
jgi:hypothetical protein